MNAERLISLKAERDALYNAIIERHSHGAYTDAYSCFEACRRDEPLLLVDYNGVCAQIRAA